MVSVNIRMTLTYNRIRSTVYVVAREHGKLNLYFFVKRNGRCRAGSAAALLGPVTATMIGSIMAFGVTFF